MCLLIALVINQIDETRRSYLELMKINMHGRNRQLKIYHSRVNPKEELLTVMLVDNLFKKLQPITRADSDLLFAI